MLLWEGGGLEVGGGEVGDERGGGVGGGRWGWEGGTRVSKHSFGRITFHLINQY